MMSWRLEMKFVTKSILSLVMALAFTASQPSLARAERVWMPTRGIEKFGDSSTARSASACFNAYSAGGTVLAQCGGPTVTQISTDKNDPVLEWVAIQDHSVVLVDHHDNETQWASDFSGFGTTNWQADGLFVTQAYTSHLGGGTGDPERPARSVLSLGYTSYFMQSPMLLGDQQFFIGSPSSVNYYLPGCPMYEKGQTDENQKFQCPKVQKNAGEFKFSVLGLLSGASINRLNTATPPSNPSNGAKNPQDSSPNDVDIADYKTMIYRSTLDIGAMGSTKNGGTVHTWFSGGGLDGKNFSEVNSTTNIAGSTLHIESNATGEIRMYFRKYYSTGKFTRKYDDLVSTFGSFPCSGQMDECTRDITGFEDAPNSFPAGANENVKKVGIKGTTTKAELKQMAGAPNLEVSEVREMKITMRPGACFGRPSQPAASDPSGLLGKGWVNAPTDCPWWYRATSHDGKKWAVDKGSSACAGGFDGTCSEDDLVQDDMIECIAGSCFYIDFHFDLGGKTENSRTVLGNPENSPEYGWEKGVFFMYDPTIGTAGDSGGVSSSLVIGLAVAGVALLLGGAMYVKAFWKQGSVPPEDATDREGDDVQVVKADAIAIHRI